MAKTKREKVMERLAEVEKWSAEGKSVRWIAQQLGVSKTFLYDMMKQDREIEEAIVENKPEPQKVDILDGQPSGLSAAIKNGRDQAVEKIESTMFMAATGYTRTEKKYVKLKSAVYDPVTGKKVEEHEELVEVEEEKYYPPDATSGIFLLKNWAKYANEPVTNDLRRREIELKEKQAEANDW